VKTEEQRVVNRSESIRAQNIYETVVVHYHRRTESVLPSEWQSLHIYTAISKGKRFRIHAYRLIRINEVTIFR